MIRKELGTTGICIPEVGIGTWDYHAGPEPLRRGLAAGALFIDTAESYGTETVVGEAIAGIREQVFLATKISPENFRRDDLRRSVDLCLQRLRVDTIDLLQLHQPNPAVPIDETMGAMTELVEKGKVRFIGVSNFSVAQLQEAQKASPKYPIVSNQFRYSLIDRTIERDLLPYCQANRVTVIAYSPLARGLDRIQDCDPNRCLERLVRETGKTSSQIILNWCLCKDNVVVIPKGNSVGHILENCGASDWRLDSEQIALLNNSIQFRQRGTLDILLRQLTPGPVRKLGLRMLQYLPRGLRRRIT